MRSEYIYEKASRIVSRCGTKNIIKLNEMNQLGWELKLPYVPRGDFLKSVRPEM